MDKLIRYLSVDFEMLTKHKWDKVLIIDGDEGTSKSNLALTLVDLWQTALNGEVKPTDIDNICLNIKQFGASLRKLPPYNMVVYDEAGELTKMRMMSRFNNTINLAYQVIRGRSYFSILVLPSVFDLDSRFTKRRARGYIHIYKRGVYGYFNKTRLRMMMDNFNKTKSENRARASVKPLFVEKFPEYKDTELRKLYDKKKEKRMQEITEILDKLDESEESGINEFSKDNAKYDGDSDFNNLSGKLRNFKRPRDRDNSFNDY